FTKCDLVAGFSEFFENLGKREREQVWGITFPYSDDPDANPAQQFDAEFDLLLRRLNERLLMRIGEEPDIGRRAPIAGLPKRMAALKATLAALLKELFAGSRFETGPLLRGAYFTRGTQEGPPLDRLMGWLARTCQIDAQAMPAGASRGKSYFITDVLKRVAFTEAHPARPNPRA